MDAILLELGFERSSRGNAIGADWTQRTETFSKEETPTRIQHPEISSETKETKEEGS
jgi:hypothetical protein